MKGAVWTLLGLTLLQAALSGRTNTGRIGELGQGIANVLSYVIDPDKPAIPDLRSTTAAAGKDAGRGTAPRPATTAPTPLMTGSPNSSSSYVTA